MGRLESKMQNLELDRGSRSKYCLLVLGFLVVLTLICSLALAENIAAGETLPKIKLAPEFTLTNQDGKRLGLKDLRGKALAVTFIFAGCADTCPLLTAKMARIQDRLGAAFGQHVNFLSITVDPERDTPVVLKRYANAYKANPAGWAFLTGTPERSAMSPSATASITRKHCAAMSIILF